MVKQRKDQEVDLSEIKELLGQRVKATEQTLKESLTKELQSLSKQCSGLSQSLARCEKDIQTLKGLFQSSEKRLEDMIRAWNKYMENIEQS